MGPVIGTLSIGEIVPTPPIRKAPGRRGYENAGMPVIAWPRISVWISLVPS